MIYERNHDFKKLAYISTTRKGALRRVSLIAKPDFKDTTSKSAMMDENESQYNDGNRAFLQALMARGTMTFKEGQEVLAAIFTVQEGQSSISYASRPTDTSCRERNCP